MQTLLLAYQTAFLRQGTYPTYMCFCSVYILTVFLFLFDNVRTLEQRETRSPKARSGLDRRITAVRVNCDRSLFYLKIISFLLHFYENISFLYSSFRY